jgi:hypothetical protein
MDVKPDLEEDIAMEPKARGPWDMLLDPEIEALMDDMWNSGEIGVVDRSGTGKRVVGCRGDDRLGVRRRAFRFHEHVRYARVWFDKAKALGWTVEDFARRPVMAQLASGVVTAVTADVMLVQQPDGERVRIERLGPVPPTLRSGRTA